MITIVENSYQQIENMEFFSGYNKKSKSHQISLKEKLLKIKNEKKMKKDISKNSSPMRYPKPSSPNNLSLSPNKSTLYVNSSSFAKQNSIKTRSFEMDYSFEMDISMTESFNIEKSMSNLIEEEFLIDDEPAIKNEEKPPIIIDQKVMYFDIEENAYRKIPDEYCKFLIISFNEFEETKNNYIAWLKNKRLVNASKKNNISDEDYYKMKVPELNLKLIIDRTEKI